MRGLLFSALSLFCAAFGEDWMQEQIDADLVFWQKKRLSKLAIRQAFLKAKGKGRQLIHVIWRDGLWEFHPENDTLKKSNRFNIVKVVFSRLLKGESANCEFLLSLNDGIPKSWQLGVPVFGFAKVQGDPFAVCVPDPEALQGYTSLKAAILKSSAKYPWHMKEEVAFWRGVTTGGWFDVDNCLSYPRSKLVLLSMQYPKWVDARYTYYGQLVGEGVREKLEYFCPKAPRVPPQEHLRYKYLVNVDGNSCSYGRMFWILTSNSLLMKQETDATQWYYRAVAPWLHYVPVSEDMADLLEKIEWAKQNDALCLEMSIRATLLAENIFSSESLKRYLLHLFRTYSDCFDAE